MCTRVFDRRNKDFPVTSRNMDWFGPIPTYLYFFPRDQQKVGLAEAVRLKHDLNEQTVFNWISAYSSIGTVVGSEDEGYCTVDGLNYAGLAVNALFDTDTDFTFHGDVSTKAMSVLRWPQFILDCFDSVDAAVRYFTDNSFQFICEKMTDGSKLDATAHLCLSDKKGDSAIFELREGRCVIYTNVKDDTSCGQQLNEQLIESNRYCIATNQPSYDIQLQLESYWQYLWGKSEVVNKHPIYTAPGGNSTTQRFERASYYLTFSDPVASQAEARVQARGLVGTCAVPKGFNPFNDDVIAFTIWANIAEHQTGNYYLASSFSMNTVWLNGAQAQTRFEQTTARVLVVSDEEESEETLTLSGDLYSFLSGCDPIFTR